MQTHNLCTLHTWQSTGNQYTRAVQKRLLQSHYFANISTFKLTSFLNVFTKTPGSPLFNKDLEHTLQDGKGKDNSTIYTRDCDQLDYEKVYFRNREL